MRLVVGGLRRDTVDGLETAQKMIRTAAELHGAVQNIQIRFGKSQMTALIDYEVAADAWKAYEAYERHGYPESWPHHRAILELEKLSEIHRPAVDAASETPPVTARRQFLSPPPGLIVTRDFVSEREESDLENAIALDAVNWSSALRSRRVQHFGYEFNYVERKPNPTPVRPLPTFIEFVVHRMSTAGHFSGSRPDQMTINDYPPGSGISPHVDTHSVFGPEIASLSLFSDAVMRFIDPFDDSGQNDFEVLLPRRSLLVMRDEFRLRFKHGIPSRKGDHWQNEYRPRNRRVSLTFRTIRDPAVCHCSYAAVCDSQLMVIPKALVVGQDLPSNMS